MGYTHYWRFHDKEALQRVWPQLVKDIRLIVDKAGVALDGTETIDDTKDLKLNGAKDEYEDFCFGPGMPRGFNCCKTARREYDLVVCAILLRATHLLSPSALEVRSDGLWEEEGEWKEPAELVRKLWPYDLVEYPWPQDEEE